MWGGGSLPERAAPRPDCPIPSQQRLQSLLHTGIMPSAHTAAREITVPRRPVPEALPRVIPEQG